ncbi:DUF6752 domain-containing protein [Leucobacter sp.]
MNLSSLPRRAFGRVRRVFNRHGATVHRLEQELRAERERISRLEADLDELRRDSLRVAELVDLVERGLTPHSDHS